MTLLKPNMRPLLMKAIDDPKTRKEVGDFVLVIDSENYERDVQHVCSYLAKYGLTANIMPLAYNFEGKFDKDLRKNPREAKMQLHEFQSMMKEGWEEGFDLMIVMCDYDRTILNDEMFTTLKTLELSSVRRIKLEPEGFTAFSLIREFKKRDLI